VVTPAIGRLSAILKAMFEQGAPLDEALMQDLLLEHQLLDRATYLKALAESTGETQVRQLADRLIEAHAATVEWLTVVLAEDALGGPAALQATPLQRVAGGVARAVNSPVRFVANRVNTAVDTVQQAGEDTAEGARSVVGRATALADAARETLAVGRAASLRRAERIARREGRPEAAQTARAAREELGDVSAAELPIRNYDNLSTTDAAKAVKQLKEPRDIRVIIRYEETHKNRSDVVSAAQVALADVAKDVVGVKS
jgi:hypothetical protein